MTLKIYQKFGLRRDNNLGDLTNASTGLTNILNDVVSGQDFRAEDLSVIKGMYSQGLDADTFLQVGGSAEEVTIVDDAGRPVDEKKKPYVSYKNRLDLSAIYAGTPRIYGGDGLNASYYDFDQVATTIPTNDNDIINSGVWVSGNPGIPFAKDQFWEKGRFGWAKKLHEKSASVGGGIEWEGYYVPTGTGNHSFDISTSGCWTFDFQREDYPDTNGFKIGPNEDWDTNTQTNDTGVTVYKNYAIIRPEVDISCTRINNTQLQIVNESDYNKIAIGMTCIEENYIEGGTQGTVVSSYSRLQGIITLDSSANAIPVKTALSSAQNIKFVHDTDQTTRNTYSIPYPLTKGVPYRIKLRYFIPTYWDSNKSTRFMTIIETIPNGGSQSGINYRKLYSLGYDFTNIAKGSFNKFIDNSILFGGGETGGSTQDKYTSIYSTKKVDARYDPINLTLTDDYNTSISNGKSYRHKKIEVWTGSKSVVQGSTSMSIDDTSGIEVGNYIYDYSWATGGATGTKYLAEGARIEQVIVNSSIIIDKPFDNTGTTTFKIIEHRGHIQRFIANSTNNSDTLNVNTSGPTLGHTTEDVLKRKMIVVGGSATLDRNTQIKKRPINNSSLELTTNAKNTTTNQVFYVYDYQGLINDSLVPFCDTDNTGLENLCVDVVNEVPAGTSAGTNIRIEAGVDTIDKLGTILSDPTLTANHRVLGLYFKDGTKMTSFSAISATRGDIVLNEDTDKLIKAGNNFTITIKSDGDRSMCCPPKDTAPPFSATDDGMETKEDVETLDVLSGNVIFDNIRATLEADEILEPNGTDTDESGNLIDYNNLLNKPLNRRILFKGGDGNIYRLFVEKP